MHHARRLIAAVPCLSWFHAPVPCTQPHVGRYTTGVWTYRYLREQLLVALAGRAAEELVLGREELSSLNQHRLQFARQIAFKMMNSGARSGPKVAIGVAA